MKTSKGMILVLIIFVLNINFVFAHGNFSEIEEIIKNKISCDKLTNEQLEEIGDYYMEQMHPGEAHELMDKMMGGEGSESLKQMHINMAKTIYCGESSGMMGGGMMNMMGNDMMNGGMTGGMMPMGGGMMANYGYGTMGNMMGYPYGWGIWGILSMLIWVGIIALIFWLIYRFVIQKSAGTPVEILKNRYARGEISKKEFEEMKKELTK